VAACAGRLVVDTGKRRPPEANRLILDTCLTTSILGEVDAQSQVIGRVEIGPRSRVTNCTIRGPVVIGSDCYLKNCLLVPGSIADQVIMMEHSVVLQGAQIANSSTHY